ncbi:MAG: serine hydrolase [Acetobacteraceae bacterium]
MSLVGALAASPARAEVGFRAPSYIVINARSGQVITAVSPDARRYPASLTKLMTLYLAFGALRDRRITLETRLPVSRHAAAVEPVKLGLRPGSTISVRDAILGMVTLSANDAATVLGEYLGGGSETRFAQMMTLRAHAIGMTHTVFRDASGLPAPGQHTTARDIAILARRLILDFPNQYHWFSTRRFLFRGRWIASDDSLLGTYPGADGMKTGYTHRAGHNLVSSALHGDVRLIAVALGAQTIPQVDGEMIALLNQGFAEQNAPEPHLTEVAAGPLGDLIPTAHAGTPSGSPNGSPAALPEPPRARPSLRPARMRIDPPGGWGVQVAAYRSHHMAIYVSGLAARVVPGRPVIETTVAHGHTLWRVRFLDMSAATAKTACHNLRHYKLPCWLLAPRRDGELASR